MSPKGRANQTSWKPKEGKRFAGAIKISLHAAEMGQIGAEAEGEGVTPAEWARDAVRDRLSSLYGGV